MSETIDDSKVSTPGGPDTDPKVQFKQVIDKLTSDDYLTNINKTCEVAKKVGNAYVLTSTVASLRPVLESEKVVDKLLSEHRTMIYVIKKYLTEIEHKLVDALSNLNNDMKSVAVNTQSSSNKQVMDADKKEYLEMIKECVRELKAQGCKEASLEFLSNTDKRTTVRTCENASATIQLLQFLGSYSVPKEWLIRYGAPDENFTRQPKQTAAESKQG